MGTVLLAPRDSSAARTAGDWAEALLGSFVRPAHLLMTKVRNQVDDELRLNDHLMFFGHGEVDALVAYGFRNRRIDLVDEANIGPVRGRIVVAVACSSAEALGPAATDRGHGEPLVEAFLGWPDEVGWPPSWPGPIGEAVVRGLHVLIAGGTIDESANALRSAFALAHDQYRQAARNHGLSPFEARQGRLEATYWADRLRVLGTGTARL
jgi:hypothetical protein